MFVSGLRDRLLGLEDTQQVQGVSLSLGAPWAEQGPAWMVLGCLVLIASAVLFYLRWQPPRRRLVRTGLAWARAAVLVLILAALAEPALTLVVLSRPRPSLWLLLDGTDSMAIADAVAPAERAALARAVGMQGVATADVSANTPPPTRIDYLKALLQKKDDNLLTALEKQFRLRAFSFEGPTGVRLLELAPGGRSRADGRHLAGQLTTRGQVTALGAAIGDLTQRHATGSLAGVVIFSDFNQNSGPSAVEAARQLGVKVYTVGVGPSAALDLSVAIQAPLVTKKDERATVAVNVQQQGLAGTTALVRLAARPVGATAPSAAQEPMIGQKSIRLAEASHTLEFAYVPEQAGQVELAAEIEPGEGETLRDNNRAVREMAVRDDFIRLLFVEYEPTWEWRFIKEVFHRDKLVGTRGFRTFLRSSDPKVRQAGELFLPTMAPPRAEFFAHDVILLGDLPASALSSRFCEMAEEFVRQFGGGLVVLSGPRFGPGQLAETPLAKMLPGVVDPAGRLRDREPLALRLRRMFGERYYRQFWGQMLHRLAMSHALGTQKRFVVRTDRQRYQPEDRVLLSVEAYDNDFQPMAEQSVPGAVLRGELILPQQAAREGAQVQTLSVPLVRKGLFETRFPVLAGGEYRLRVTDPLGGLPAEVAFMVASASLERQRPVRNTALQEAIAETSGGRSYDLASVARLPAEVQVAPKGEILQKVIPLGSTWLAFCLVAGLLLTEWAVRKWSNLP